MEIESNERQNELPAGEVLCGRYRVSSVLKHDSSGICYRCYDKISCLDVAVTVLSSQFSPGAQAFEEMQKNFRKLQQFNHPGIVTYKALEQDAERACSVIVTELVTGATLRQWLETCQERPPVAEIMGIIDHVAQALDVAHQQKILHQDVCLENVMMLADGKVKLINFALSSAPAGAATLCRAPEQWRQGQVSAASDVYALGVLAYEMLSGRPPFAARDLEAMRQAALYEAPSPLSDVSPEVSAAIMRALSKEPSSRFSSCVAFSLAMQGKTAKASGGYGRWLALAAAVIAVIAAVFLLLPRGETPEGEPETAVSVPETTVEQPPLPVPSATPVVEEKKPKVVVKLAQPQPAPAVKQPEAPAKPEVVKEEQPQPVPVVTEVKTVEPEAKPVEKTVEPKETAPEETADSLYRQALKYYFGKGVKKDLGAAVDWYRRAADKGHVKAQHNLALCYTFGQGVEKNYAEAVAWYRQAADKGYDKSQYNLGICYLYGHGVEKDEAEAVAWLLKAARQKHVKAQLNLGNCYYQGQGVDKDLVQAAHWYRRAAEQGDGNAQYLFGLCCVHGYGVEKDETEAAKWFLKAAQKGEGAAQRNLGFCYESGRGVEKNLEEAMKWYRRASQSKDAKVASAAKKALKRLEQ